MSEFINMTSIEIAGSFFGGENSKSVEISRELLEEIKEELEFQVFDGRLGEDLLNKVKEILKND